MSGHRQSQGHQVFIKHHVCVCVCYVRYGYGGSVVYNKVLLLFGVFFWLFVFLCVCVCVCVCVTVCALEENCK